MTALMALLGALAGLGVLLAAAGFRGMEPHAARPPRQKVELAVDRGALRLGLAVVGGVLMALLTRWPVGALLVAAAGFSVPSFLGGKAAREASIARVEAVAAWAEMLRDTMAGAGGLEQSIVASAPVAPVPIRREVTALADRLGARMGLSAALRAFADDLDDPSADLVVAALVLAADKSPKRLGNLLGMLAASARAEVNMRLRVDAGRARARTSVRVVTVSTIVFALLLLVLNRGYLKPYDTALGQLVLAMVGACFASSFWWMARTSQIQGHDRFLVQASGGRT